MRKEIFFEVLGELDGDLVEGAKSPGKGKNGRKLRWACGAAAACLCAGLLGGIIFRARRPDTFQAMIAGYSADTTVHYASIAVADRVACYHEVAIDSSKLERYLGEPYAAAEDGTWYTPAGAADLKYLIRQESGGDCSLWVFSDFVVGEGGSYTYGEVLKLIYGVTGAGDIVRITAAPSNSNNTELGIAIQKEVGTKEYTGREEIEAFYNIAAGVICYGADSISREDDTRFTYSFSTDQQDKLTSGESTYGTRVLQVELASGTTIDSWKYNALSGCFFEYGGIFTEPLSDEAAYRLNDIFGIQ